MSTLNLNRFYKTRATLIQLTDIALILIFFLLFRFIDTHNQSLLNSWTKFTNDVANFKFGISYILLFLFPYTLYKLGFYSQKSRQSTIKAIVQLIFSVCILEIIFIIIPWILLPSQGNYWITRALFAGKLLFAISIPVFVRFLIVHYMQKYKDKHRQNKITALIVASKKDAQSFIQSIPQGTRSEYNFIGNFDSELGSEEDFKTLLTKYAVSRVFFLSFKYANEQYNNYVTICELQGIDICLHCPYLAAQIAKPSVDYIGPNPVILYRSTPENTVALFIKSLLDKAMALCGIIGTSPLWIIAIIAIKKSDPGPIFFRQPRSGKYGKPFNMWKFRTMKVGADKILENIKAEYGNDMSGPIFKLENDPRIFNAGRWMRKYSIDELPQLINILVGDMSVVGPRPLPVYETASFTELEQRRRLSVTPGLTCYWQIEGRSDIKDFNELVKLDFKYIDHWNIFLDFWLILRTIPAVIFGKGAK